MKALKMFEKLEQRFPVNRWQPGIAAPSFFQLSYYCMNARVNWQFDVFSCPQKWVIFIAYQGSFNHDIRDDWPISSSSLLKKLLRDPIAASRARSLLGYLSDMSCRSLRGSLHSGRSLRFFQQTASSVSDSG